MRSLVALGLSMIILSCLVGCNGNYSQENEIIEIITPPEITAPVSAEDIELVYFITLPNGILADTRVSEDIADVIIRHFAAIERQDVQAFIDTLIAQDGVDINHQVGLMLRYFEHTLLAETVGEDWVQQGLYDSSGMARYGGYGGTGLSVREIALLPIRGDVSQIGNLRVMIENDFDLDIAVWLDMGFWDYALVDGKWVGYDPRISGHRTPRLSSAHLQNPGWYDPLAQVLLIDFIRRNYPSEFLGGEEFSAYHLRTRFRDDITIRVRLEFSHGFITRIYRLYPDSVLRIVHETDHEVAFFKNTDGEVIIVKTAADGTVSLYRKVFIIHDGHLGVHIWDSYQFIKEPITKSPDDAREFITTLIPLDDIITDESRKIIEARARAY